MIPSYHEQIQKLKGEEKIPMILIGNKKDKEELREVTQDQARQMSVRLGCKWYETSCVDGSYIEDAIYDLVNIMNPRKRGHKRGWRSHKIKPVRCLEATKEAVSSHKLLISFSSSSAWAARLFQRGIANAGCIVEDMLGAIGRHLNKGGRCVPLTRTSRNVSVVRPLNSVPTQKLNTRAAPSSPQKLSESFLSGSSAIYIEEMFEAWKKDNSSVHASWNAYFKSVERGARPGEALAFPDSFGEHITVTGGGSVGGGIPTDVNDSIRLLLLVRAYQVRGHMLADLDPLRLTKNPTPPELELSSYGFTEADMDREFTLGGEYLSGFLSRPKTKLRDIVSRLKETYCSTIGYEYMHIQDRDRCNWLRDRIETPQQYKFSKEDKTSILDRLTWATEFELFLNRKWQGTKRFGVDGCEGLIPGIKAMIDKLSDHGAESVVMGMAHRGPYTGFKVYLTPPGRLNVLANVVRKPLDAIFHEFGGGSTQGGDFFYTGSGDVKYHLGTSYDRQTRNGKAIHLSLLANPSHLEAVNPVVEGKVRAKQQLTGDHERKKTVSVLIHGDASVAAQGIVYETVGLSGLRHYTTGGSIHVVINNQIGFTTDPRDARGNVYCTDVAKISHAPVFHVNGDDPEAITHAFQLAAEWRQTFHSDVFIDIICYRKFGHNEGDEPRFTQPVMYKAIDQQRSTLEQYKAQLLQEGTLNEKELAEIDERVKSILEQKYKESPDYKSNPSDWFDSHWQNFRSQTQQDKNQWRNVSTDTIKKVGKALYTIPEDITLHPNIKKIIQGRQKVVESGQNIDWGTAESLAYGTLLLEGRHVRVSGQDCERGTFSHRHAVLHDQNSDKTYEPLNNIDPEQAPFNVCNSSLSEFGVLGFELGYSLENPNMLVVWEAQFGDFANGAQVMIDQFVAAGEAKWRRQSGLVLLLPHGYDGSGPEHSSARLERFLQMSDSDPDVIPSAHPEQVAQLSNWTVANITSPSNFFHAMRRQIIRDFRKPMVVMSPKNLLKHRHCHSPIEEFTSGQFRRVIGETKQEIVDNADKVKRVLFCSGKVYFDLADEREKQKKSDVAIVRVEQIYPFPFDLVAEEAARYPQAEEEHKNAGAWNWIAPHIRTALKEKRGDNYNLKYAGRASAASPATGFKKEHDKQQAALISTALTL
ncbi:2-oxoglutarate dehydrogenase, E1 subunit [Planoprotostelium fungivorum]|uniref:2-oxoglutarate dehydrogenase, mitochondrial n=1 Tax=Planoprotostelium fungivorum TaxID=1890364 RepID=A0A2P6NNJ7_9EUKA|nr:2-oxoglutarate dehydrogenase, E1 subunit [Planoprotostelium fungivorum]